MAKERHVASTSMVAIQAEVPILCTLAALPWDAPGLAGVPDGEVGTVPLTPGATVLVVLE
jgi:hypothetical protein